MFPTLFSTFFNFSGAQWYFQKKVRKKIYPKRAIGLNLFTKNAGGNYFFTVAEINAETYFECSQTQKMQKKLMSGLVFIKNGHWAFFFYIFSVFVAQFFEYLLHIASWELYWKVSPFRSFWAQERLYTSVNKVNMDKLRPKIWLK